MSILSFAKKYIKREQEQPRSSAAVKKEKKVPPVRKRTDYPAQSLDLQPRVTEKGVKVQKKGFVNFRVPPGANKNQIKQAVESKYGVKVAAVRTLMVAARARQRGHTVGRTTHWKKAYVKVDDVQKINAGP